MAPWVSQGGSRLRRKRRAFVCTAAGLAAWVLVLAVWSPGRSGDGLQPRGRSLQSGGGDCGEYSEWEENGGVILYFLGIVYLFLGIAIICDDFFVASLETISEKLNLSEDVAGATFMAAGSSAPELFSSLVSLTNKNASNEIGVGTIVGSAVFNILVIIGVTAIFAGQTLQLDWRPVARDAVFYTASIVGIIGIFLDQKVYWWEGLLSVLCYGAYIVFMSFNARAMAWLDDKFGRSNRIAGTDNNPDEALSKGLEAKMANKTPGGDGKPLTPSGVDGVIKGEDAGWIQATNLSSDAAEKGQQAPEEEEGSSSPFSFPENKASIPIWLLSLPWFAAFTYTVPNCKQEKWEKWYMVSFLVSIGWIGAISWYMVEWAADIGCLLNIPPAIMGVTVLAAGTSIPDALSSIVVAKQGMGDMAVANAVGSNVFDIWLGLGFPWLIILPFKTGGHIEVPNDQLLPNILILFAVLVLYILALVVARWKLFVSTGYVLVCAYGLYAIYNILVWQLDVYG